MEKRLRVVGGKLDRLAEIGSRQRKSMGQRLRLLLEGVDALKWSVGKHEGV